MTINTKKKILALLLLLCLLSPGGWKTTAANNNPLPGAMGNAKIHPHVRAAMENQEYLEVLVTLADQADTEKAAQGARKALQGSGKNAEIKVAVRTGVVNSLLNHAKMSQAGIVAALKRGQERGRVGYIKEYFIVNMLLVEAKKEVILELSQRPEVASITPNFEILREDPAFQLTGTLYGDQPEWNLEKIKAPMVWSTWQLRGSGVVVGIIDSGVDWQHPALQKQWRGFREDNPGSPESEFNWLDLINNEPLPVDPEGHGTHVAGIILGRDADTNNYTGVAPEARWIAVKAFQGTTAKAGDLITAGQYLLAPTDTQGIPHPGQAPDIINNSWGAATSLDQYEWYRDMVKAWQNAGIFCVSAAGNLGQNGENSILTPAGYPESMAVAATNSVNSLASFSSRGPGLYEGIMKPDISAPGVYIRSTLPGGNYGTASGTSMASPHVAGAAALLLAANPGLTPTQLQEAMLSTAIPLTDANYPESPNPGYGYGLVDVYAAVALTLETAFTVERIAGADRYETAAAISMRGWERSGTVILARGDDYADALVGAPLAYQLDAPILLTRPFGLPEATKTEIVRLAAENVVILGGMTAVGKEVEDMLGSMGLTVERISGADRYATAALLAARVAPGGADRAVVAYGLNFPDALSVAAYAARAGYPILLTDTEAIPLATQEALMDLGFQNTLVVGGNAVISDAVAAQLPAAERVSGPDRYATAIALYQYFLPTSQDLFIVTGTEFADAVTGAVLAAGNDSGILLVQKNSIPEVVKNYLRDCYLGNYIILGGTTAISEGVAAELVSGW